MSKRSGTDSEYAALADAYQRGLDKCLSSGYEEFGPKFIREREMVISALRASATPPAAPAIAGPLNLDAEMLRRDALLDGATPSPTGGDAVAGDVQAARTLEPALRGRMEHLPIEKLAKHFKVSIEQAQAAQDDIGFMYRELAIGCDQDRYKLAWDAYVEASMHPEIRTFDCIKRAVDAALTGPLLKLLSSSNLPMEGDLDVLQVARAIAERGIGRYWDDFPETDAFDTDQGDLIEYARAAVEVFRRSVGVAQPSPDETELALLAKRIAGAELNYRSSYQLNGTAHIETGRKWDKMRKAGDAIRQYFFEREEASTLPSTDSK